jgi:N-hydroxyarylamine O-acetyltransferase
VTDEWEASRLDLRAYLRRVGVTDGPPPPTAETLRALHRAHVAAIAFENLDIRLGRGVDVGLEAVQAKLVDRRRGGYCFEQNSLFGAALERLGFPVERRLARVGGTAERPNERNHLVLRVAADGEWWLADVGFGSGLLEPVPFDAGGPVEQGAWTLELVATGPGGWELRERQRAGWTTHYRFRDELQHPADVEVANHYTSTFPRSVFVIQSVVVAKDEHAVRRLVDRRFDVATPDGAVEQRRLGDAEYAAALRETFGLALDDAEIERLLALG